MMNDPLPAKAQSTVARKETYYHSDEYKNGSVEGLWSLAITNVLGETTDSVPIGTLKFVLIWSTSTMGLVSVFVPRRLTGPPPISPLG